MNSTQYIRRPEGRQRFKYVVCWPSTRDTVRAFDTLKAARNFAENMPVEGGPWKYPIKAPIPIISRETIAKYNLRGGNTAA
jgi:hypothetical protein